MSAARQFDHPAPDTWRITCCQCSRQHLWKASFGAKLAAELVPRKFQMMGWKIGKKPSLDLCPACVKEARDARLSLAREKKVIPMKKEAASTTQAPALALVADPPRDMTRDERRLIFGKLDEVYLDERRGYDDGWSDKRVAADLGVPRAWVAKIRDENFGADNTNIEARAAVTEAKALLARVDVIVEQAAELRKRIERIERAF